MANVRWKGGAPAVAQVDTLTVGGTIEATDIFIMTIGNKSLSVVAASTVAATVATTIAAAWNAMDSEEYPEFAEITALATAGGALTLTADTPGKPFTVTVSTTETGGGAADAQTFGTAATTANSGPNVCGTAANWDRGGSATVPQAADDIFIDNSSVSILYDISQAGTTFTSLTISNSFTGTIGLPETNEDAANGTYKEYRTQYLTIDCTTVNIGDTSGQGSSRIKINAGTVQTTLNVKNTGTSQETDLEAVLWKGTNASNAVNINGGSVGIAVFGGETATVSALRVQSGGPGLLDADVRMGAGVTWTTLTMNAGDVEVRSGGTTVSKVAGTLTIMAGNVTTLSDDTGTTYYQGTGTITTANIGGGASLDMSRDIRTRTITTLNLHAGSTFNDPAATTTLTNGFVAVRCALPDITVNCGQNKTYTVA
jgi:hypothetical protein